MDVDETLSPTPDDPIWMQYVPHLLTNESDPIDLLDENWEEPKDMVTPILQHKYPNRANFRIQNSCLAYCMYCFEAKRVLASEQIKEGYSQSLFKDSVEYVRRHPEIEEIVLSGGEPLVLNNEKLGHVLSQIRSIRSVRAVRIQTRALSHNPFRIDDGLLDLLGEYDVTAMGIHVSHPVEITQEFCEAIARLQSLPHPPLLLPQIPLLKGINDSLEILRSLLLQLYVLKTKPYYLLHSMPFTASPESLRTSVQKGVQLMRQLRRHFSGPAVPEYVIVHHAGKHTVPIELAGSDEFRYLGDMVEFINWRGDWCRYENPKDS
jgi:lysine 2,3-aminomutase